jgi:hypothetical protein
MVSNPNLGHRQVAQAVYTWSQTLVDGTRGVGFSAISPSLVTSIDWLTRLKLPEFRLFKTDSPTSELYEARKGFSEVGRLVKNDIGIVYRKTADGAMDTSGRPQPVVHAFFANARSLGFLSPLHIREELWIRKLQPQSAAGLRLSDMQLEDVVAVPDGFFEHACPEDHEGAKELLRFLVAQSIEDGQVIHVPQGIESLPDVALAFPTDIVDGFSFTSFVEIRGTRCELKLRLPQVTAESTADRTDENGCQFRQAVLLAARRYLYVEKPSMKEYAKSVIDIEQKLTAPAEEPRASHVQQLKIARPPGESGWWAAAATPTQQPLDGSRAGRYLTDDENRQLLEKLSRSGRAAQILAEDPEVLRQTFGLISEPEVVMQWTEAWSGLDAQVFGALWNKTHIAIFLGVVLLKNLPSADESATAPILERVKIAPHRGLFEEVTKSILQSTRIYPGGDISLGHAIQCGLGSTESMQKFISETFSNCPDYLYDNVLPNAGLSSSDMIGYIRFGYAEWAQYRKLPESEAAALRALFSPKIMDFFKWFVRNRLPGHDDQAGTRSQKYKSSPSTVQRSLPGPES